MQRNDVTCNGRSAGFSIPRQNPSWPPYPTTDDAVTSLHYCSYFLKVPGSSNNWRSWALGAALCCCKGRFFPAITGGTECFLVQPRGTAKGARFLWLSKQLRAPCSGAKPLTGSSLTVLQGAAAGGGMILPSAQWHQGNLPPDALGMPLVTWHRFWELEVAHSDSYGETVPITAVSAQTAGTVFLSFPSSVIDGSIHVLAVVVGYCRGFTEFPWWNDKCWSHWPAVSSCPTLLP